LARLNQRKIKPGQTKHNGAEPKIERLAHIAKVKIADEGQGPKKYHLTLPFIFAMNSLKATFL